MSKGGGDAPAPLDVNALVDAQSKANRVSTITPFGTQAYGKIDAQGNFVPALGDDQAAVKVFETPAQTQYRQTYETGAQTLGNTGLNLARVFGNAPVADVPHLPGANSRAGVPAMTDALGVDLRSSVDKSNIPGLVTALNRSGLPSIQTGVNLGALGGYQTGIDRSGFTALPGTDDFGARAGEVTQGRYQRALDLMSPEWDREYQAMQQNLADRGIPVGSEAYTLENDRFQRMKDNARTAAAYDALGAGSAEDSRLFGQAVTARGVQGSEAMSDADLWNQARAAAFGENYQNAGFNNAARNQLFGEELTSGQFTNSANQQQFSQNLADAQLFNQANAQKFQQALAMAQLETDNAASQYQMDQGSRNNILNMAQGILGGTQVQAPQMSGTSPVDVMSPALANYQNQMQQWQAGNAQNNAMLGGLFSLGGTLGAATLLCFAEGTKVEMADGSDRPIEDIECGDTTRGGRVLAVIVGSNPAQPMVRYKDVHVQAGHFVRDDDGRWRAVGESAAAVPAEGVDKVWTLITSGHRIFVSGIEFEDHDPGYGSESWERYRAETFRNIEGRPRALPRELMRA